ncbi:ATP synthase d subunit [Chytridiales sp. JEL 0842]|nr:ATP synthase d subunit [Chytridiales sp. JEL 0842]
MASSAITKVNWGALSSKLKPETVAAVNSFRRRQADLQKTLDELKEANTSIDFESYRKILANKKVVADAEKAFAAFKPATYDLTEQLRIIQEQETKAVAAAEKTAAKINVELKELNELLTNIETARPVDQLTVEDVAHAYPELDNTVAKMAKRGQWIVPGYYERFGQFSIELNTTTNSTPTTIHRIDPSKLPPSSTSFLTFLAYLSFYISYHWRIFFNAINHWLFSNTPSTVKGSAAFTHSIVIVGDDFAYGFGDTSGLGTLPGVGRHLKGRLVFNQKVKHCWRVYNKGIVGSLSSDWVPASERNTEEGDSYFEKVFRGKPGADAEIVIILLGFNDVRAKLLNRSPVSAEQTLENLIKLCKVLRNMGKDVVISRISTWGDKAVLPLELVEENKERNEILGDWIETNELGVLKGPDLSAEGYDFKSPSFYYIDGVHFSTRGYAKYAKDLEDVMLNTIVKKEFASIRKELGI